MGRGWRAASLALVAVLALGAGCSSSSSSSGDSSTTTTAAPSGGGSSTTTAKATTTTEATSGSTPTGSGSGEAQAALMDASALGQGWDRDVSSDAPSESVNQSFLDVPACESLASGATATPAESASASYSSSDLGTDPNVQLSIDYQVDVYESEDAAAAVVDLLGNDEFSTCFEAVLTTSAGSRGTVDSISVAPLDIPSASDLGIDAAAGVEVTGTVTTSQGTAQMLVHLVALQHGSALGFFTVTEAAVNGATTSPLEVQQRAVEDAAKKLAAIGS